MWQVLIIGLFAPFTVNAEVPSAHLGARFPYGLLGDDFGLLAACIATPEPFSPDSTEYPYWQCFSVQEASFECDSTGYDGSEKSVMAIMAIVARKNGEEHEYLSRRAIPMKGCRAHESEWKKLTARRKHVCLSGALIRIETTTEGKSVGHWIFEALKTDKGCDSYFAGGCDLKYQVKHGCEIARRN